MRLFHFFLAPNKKNNSQFGFTLAEILTVVVIVGILAGIAIPKLYPNKEKAQVAEALQILSALRRAEEAYNLEKNGYYVGNPLNWAALGMEDPGSLQWDFTTTGDWVIATRTDTTSGSAYNGKFIRLRSSTGEYCGNHPYVSSLPGSPGGCA